MIGAPLPDLPLTEDLGERFAHARDLWPRATLALRQGHPPPLPAAVASPRDLAEVERCLRWASERGVAVVPYGAGSGVCGAAAGHEGALVVDLKGLRRIGPVDAERRSVRVEAGVLGQHLEDALEIQGWATRHSPSSIWCSTAGGWAAGRSAGQFSSKYGKFEDMVRAMRVCAPARTFGTGAWADGPDLGPWVMGSEGALGIITELEVAVVPLPRARALRGWRFETVEAAWEAMRELLQAELHPAVLRLYDAVDTRVGGRLGGERASRGGHSWLAALRRRIDATPALKAHALTLPLALPGLINRIAAGGSTRCLLIAGWEGEPAVVERLERAGQAILAARGTDLGREPGERWYAHRHDVSYKLAPVFSHGGFADTMEVAALWSRLPALYDAVRRALGRHALVMAHFSHAWREGCSIYFSFAGRGDLGVYDAAWRDALAAAAAAGGTVAHHHGVGQLKQEAAAREMSGVGPIFHALRAELDPAGILNPGRLFPPVPHEPPPRPALGVDECSQVATLDAQQPASERDAWLAERGWALRFPTALPLARGFPARVEAWENPVLGCSVLTAHGRVLLAAVPRSAAGPDPRRTFPAEAYETLTVPVVRLAEPVVVVRSLAEDVRAARRTEAGLELRGPAAAALAELC